VKGHLIWLVPLALAGCKKNDVEVKNASVTEVIEKVKQSGAAQTSLKPGLWEATLKLENVAAPGAPPEVAKAMQGGIGRARTMTECLTEEDAKKPFERFVEGLNKDCRYEHFTMGGGKIDTRLVCAGNGMNREMAMQGTYGAENYRMRMVTQVSGPEHGHMSMAMSLDAHRTGDCPAKKEG